MILGMTIFNFVAWLFIGIINMSKKSVSKSQYVIVWVMLMVQIVCDLLAKLF